MNSLHDLTYISQQNRLLLKWNYDVIFVFNQLETLFSFVQTVRHEALLKRLDLHALRTLCSTALEYGEWQSNEVGMDLSLMSMRCMLCYLKLFCFKISDLSPIFFVRVLIVSVSSR
jgi:hypothetical protein